MGPTHVVQNFLYIINTSMAMTATYTGHSKKLSNLAEINTNNISIFELKNLWKNVLNNLSKNL